MKIIPCSIAALLLAAPSWGADNPKSCRFIHDDMKRLECFDAAFAQKPEPEAPPKGDWSVRTEKSDFKDTQDVFAKIDSSSGVRCNWDSTPRPITLLLRCLENTTAMMIITHCHVTSGHGGYGKVDLRVDEGSAFAREFEASTSNDTLGLWSGRRSIPVIRDRLIGGETLKVRFTPFNDSPVQAEFNITGIGEAIEPLRKSCGW